MHCHGDVTSPLLFSIVLNFIRAKGYVCDFEFEFIWLHNKTIYNSGYSTEIVNEQCNTGDPLETSGGLYRGPPSMLIYVNTIKCCACETLNLVQCSITMNVKLLQ